MMRKSRFSEEQIIAVLQEQEVGAATADVCRRHRISMGLNRHSSKEPDLYLVNASYMMTLNSFEIGTLRYESSVGSIGQVVESEVQLFALSGYA